METKQLHVRLTADEMEVLKRTALECEVNPTVLAGFCIRASLRAFKAHGQRLRLPIDFRIIEDPADFPPAAPRLSDALNDRAPAKRTQRTRP